MEGTGVSLCEGELYLVSCTLGLESVHIVRLCEVVTIIVEVYIGFGEFTGC